MSTPGDPQGQQYGSGQYDQGQYGQGQWDPNTRTAPPEPRNGMGTAALVVGVVALLSLAISWIPFLGILCFVLGLIAAVLGFIGRGRVKKMQANNGGSALTGIVLGILSLLVGGVVQAVVIVGTVLFIQSGGGAAVSQFQECVTNSQNAGNPAAVQQALADCQEQFNQQLPSFGGQPQGG